VSCWSIEPWLHRAPEVLDESERLVLEDHLDSCQGCRTARAHLATVRRIGTSLPTRPIGPRGHARAIAGALMQGARPAAPAPRRVPWWALVMAGSAVAGAASLGGLALRSDGAGASSPTLRVGPAPSEHPAPHPAPLTQQAPTEPALPDVAVVEDTLVRDRVALPLRAARPEPTTPAARPSAAALLAQAREAFTARDYRRAERLADAALDASPRRAQAAEARTITAESAHAQGRLNDALGRYEAIASRFADLPAGETALFSAARLEANRGHGDAARTLFERYLDRFPSGRFVADTKRELAGFR
jgi:TolA-binding protein